MIDPITGLTAALSSLKVLISHSENIELSNSLIEVQNATIELQNLIFQLQNENHQLKNEVTQLKDLWKQEQDVERHDEPYITFKDDGKRIPYCENCWNKSHHKIRFIVHCTKPFYKCPECGTTLEIDESEDVTCD
ncbi:MAG TPA: hypothetical protein O0X51_01205 [Methanocorpusculum sp.]|nr:hypothetical protein [Methanocorpusculum sp.]HJK72738.1 hypothetical protein [Methanocorpusculum sp.]HJK83882.1 hypothetical protein [Methanocorpusculum sp.]